MPRMGDLADLAALPDVGQPLIPSGGQFSPGIGFVNRAVEAWGAPAPPRDETVVYPSRISPHLNITEGDLGRGMDAAMGVSGGGLATKIKTPTGRDTSRMGEVLSALPAVENPRLRAQADAVRGTYPQYAEAYPEVGPPALMQKLPDPKAPGKYLMKPGPEVPYSSMEEALAMDARPDHFLSKKKLPQVEEFANARNIIQKDLDLHGYQPYFDPAKRFDVKGEHYGPFADTGTAAAPATAKTDAEWFARYGTPENRAKLQAGFAEGKNVPESANWYHMGQLEHEYIKELGPKAGRDAFKREFGDMMAATTGGADPYNNFLMSQYANVAAKKGERLATRAYELPFPIGGRYASGNLEQAQKYIDAGMKGFDPAQNPKRYDFSSAFAGNKNASTIDEQMYGALRPPTTKPSVGLPEWYGPATRVAREEAAKAGVDARAFQDVAWAGLKKGKTGEGFDYAGPMINTLNRSIETTHQLTGMPRAEIVRRGLVRKEIPMYGIGGAAAMGALARQDKYEEQ